jgi:RimJ/RimL family protein N-acetyltransferase
MTTVSMDFAMKDGRTVTIRSYLPEDFEAMVSMFKKLSKEALRYGLPPYDRARLERWISSLDDGILLLGFDGENVVGAATIWGRGSLIPRLRGVGEFATYIHQNYHRKGLGTCFTKTILKEAKRKGFHRVSLQVVADNAGAIRAYERAGFVHEGRLKEAFLDDDGKYHDQLVMGIIL